MPAQLAPLSGAVHPATAVLVRLPKCVISHRVRTLITHLGPNVLAKIPTHHNAIVHRV
jgi:hypothetical protein